MAIEFNSWLLWPALFPIAIAFVRWESPALFPMAIDEVEFPTIFMLLFWDLINNVSKFQVPSSEILLYLLLNIFFIVGILWDNLVVNILSFGFVPPDWQAIIIFPWIGLYANPVKIGKSPLMFTGIHVIAS